MPTLWSKQVWGYLAVYLAMLVLGRFTTVGVGVSLFWPAAGIAALWILRGRTRPEVASDAVLLFVCSTVVNFVTGAPAVVAIIFGLANAVQALAVRVTYAMLRHRPFWGSLHPRMASSRDLVELAAASAVSAALGSVLGTLGVRLASGAWSWEVTLAWVVRNGCGTFVIGAALLTLQAAYAHRRAPEWRALLTAEPRRHQGLELAVVLTLSTLSVVLVFGELNRLPISFLLIALSAWVGFRFAPVVGSLHSLAVGTAAVLFTLSGAGVFGAIAELTSMAQVAQLFIAVSTLIALMLAFGVAERHALLEQVRVTGARAREQADLLRAVTSVMTDGLVVVDRNMRVLVSNPMAESLAHLAEQGNVVRDPADHGFYYDDGSPVPIEELVRLVAVNGEPVPTRDFLRVDQETGRRAVIAISSVPLKFDGSPVSDLAVVLLHDVTADRSRTRELEAFAGVAAHDLRNPLAAVQSWAMLLHDQLDDLDGDTSQARSSLEHVLGSAHRMQQLIDDLLDYAQAQSAQLRPRPIDLGELVDEVAEVLRSHRAGHDLCIEHGALHRVHADPTLVRQLLVNVLDNAVKYVVPGTSPRVRVSSRTAEEPAGLVEVHVHDNGIGIPEEDRDRVFDSFHRAQHDHAYPGTGLGLAICQRAVERHGGAISTRPGPDGTGTVVVFTLPAAPGDDAGAADGAGQRDRRTTSAEPPPRREGSDTAVS